MLCSKGTSQGKQRTVLPLADGGCRWGWETPCSQGSAESLQVVPIAPVVTEIGSMYCVPDPLRVMLGPSCALISVIPKYSLHVPVTWTLSPTAKLAGHTMLPVPLCGAYTQMPLHETG